MFRSWTSEAGFRLELQLRLSGRSFLYLFDAKRADRCLLHKEYECHQRREAENEAEALARLGLMLEASYAAA